MYDIRRVNFKNRKSIADGLGRDVSMASSIEDVMKYGDLNWTMRLEENYTKSGIMVPDSYSIIREDTNTVIGKDVSKQYQLFQNHEAIDFMDMLLGEGVTYETAGCFKGGSIVWLLAKIPDDYRINGDKVTPFIAISNRNDGGGAVRAVMTPVRIVCQNTLTLALKTAKTSWSAVHKKSLSSRIIEAKSIFAFAHENMNSLKTEMEELAAIKISRTQLERLIIPELIPIGINDSESSMKHKMEDREELLERYLYAPDLDGMEANGYRLVNAVADYADHHEPRRKDSKGLWKESRFFNRISKDSNSDLMSKARDIVLNYA